MSAQKRNQQLVNLLKQDFVTHDTHVDLHSEDLAPHDIISGHTGTGSTLDVVGFSGTDTLAVLTPSASPGAAESLLKTTGAGLLTLSSLTSTGLITTDSLTATGGNVGTDNFSTGSTGWRIPYTGNAEFRNLQADFAEIQGSLEVTNGGDLTVGTMFYVNNSGGRVGIGSPADTQFALDVDGDARVRGFLVAKLALQIDDATMICHFDGPTGDLSPAYRNEWTGIYTSHLGHEPDPITGTYFVRGKFRKAVAIGTGETNLILNPIFEDNVTDGWSLSQGGTGGTRTRIANNLSSMGTAHCKITAGTDFVRLHSSNTVGLNNGDTVVVQAMVLANSASVARLRIRDTTNSIYRASSSYHSGSGEYEFLWASWTNNTGGLVNVEMNVINDAGDSTTIIRVDECQMHGGTDIDFPTPTIHGDLPNHTWSGLAHNSTSSRNGAEFTYGGEDDAVIYPDEGTIAMWVKFLVGSGTEVLDTAPGLFQWWDAFNTESLYGRFSSNLSTLHFNSSAGSSGQNINGSVTVVAEQWHHLAFTWGSGGMFCYFDGAEVATGSFTEPAIPVTEDFRIGKIFAQSMNGYMDDLLVAHRQLPESEILAIYQSDAPVFAETSTFTWNDPKNTIWVNEDGLYARDHDDNAIMALSTVDGKSWGGFSGGNALDAGDFLLGNSGDGYLLWDLDGGSGGGKLTIKGTVDSLDIASGTVLLDSTGITIESDTNTLGGTPDTEEKITFKAATGDTISEIWTNYVESGGSATDSYLYMSIMGGTAELIFGSDSTTGFDLTAGRIGLSGGDVEVGQNIEVANGIQVGQVGGGGPEDKAIRLMQRTTDTPTSSGTGQGDLYVWEDGSGNQELRIKFDNGTVKTIVDDT